MELNFNTKPNYSGPMTTANSAEEGRLKVDASGIRKKKKKKKIIKESINRIVNK